MQRAVVFLDPFGNQVAWDTIKEIAATKAIDLWYLFPAGLGVNRQIGKCGAAHESYHARSLDKLLGTFDWRTAFSSERVERTLFEQRTETTKIATPEQVMFEFSLRRG
jgi:three-Cys-motif partner protein